MKRSLADRARLAFVVLTGRTAAAEVVQRPLPATLAGDRLRMITSEIAHEPTSRQAAQIAHRAGLRRRQRDLQASTMMGLGGWKGAELSRLTMDWLPSILPANEEMRYDVRRLRARARELARNKPAIRHYKRMVSSNVVGHQGLRLQPKVMVGEKLDAPTNATIARAWKRWTEGRVTVDQRMAWVPFLWLVAETAKIDGECLIRLYRGFEGNPCGLGLQIIDADYLDENMNVTLPNGNEIRLGIEVDKYGAPVAYHLWRDQGFPFAVPVVHERVPAEDILHVMWPERPNQARGVTATHAAMFPTQMLAGYIEAELVASRISASKMGWFTSKEGPVGELGTNDRPETMEANPGLAEALPPGWGFESWDPQHPTTAFPDFVKSGMREIATALDVSYNSLANDLEHVNFSSFRSGLLNERDMWRMAQTWLVLEVCTPIYRVWISMASLTGALTLPGRDWRLFTDHEFQPRGWAWVDPEKDVTAAAIAIGQGVSSRTRFTGEGGESFEQTIDELAAENEYAASKGVTLAPPPGSASPGAGDSSGGDGTGGSGSGGDAGSRVAMPSRNGHAAHPARFLTVD